jgi:hypothetical protein
MEGDNYVEEDYREMRLQQHTRRQNQMGARRENIKRIPPNTRTIPTMQQMQTELDTTNQWDDQLEAIRFTTRVETQISEYINSDLVMASFTDKDRQFIIQQAQLAFAFSHQIPYEEVSKRSFRKIMLPVIMTAVTKRNVPKNILLEIIGGAQRGPEEELLEEPTTLGKKFMGIFSKKDKKKQEMEGIK